ncbi:DUF4399 domain-containing protein [Haloferacaceae archaeon DSL9]
MTRHPSRRWILRTAGAATVVSLAGCLSGDDEDDSPADDENGDDAANDTDDEQNDDAGADDGLPDYDENASVSFVTPEDGETCANGVQVAMEAESFEIEEAGEPAENAGHWHVLVDTVPIEEGELIPDDDHHIHVGDGSSDAILYLEPGEHTLVLQPGDGQHRAYPITDEVEIEVVDSEVSFVEPDHGATVQSPVAAQFEASDPIAIEEAGEVTQNGGHWHVLVDTDSVPVGEIIPDDDHHIHFGDGSSEADLDLEPGEHTLVLQLGDGRHRALPKTDEITITVEE